MKKVLFIVEAMGGGVFTYIVEMANILSKKYDVYVAYGLRKQTPENYKDYFNKSVHLIHVKNFTRQINLQKDLKAFIEIRKIKRKVNPDIIHLHSSKAGILGRIAFINDNSSSIFYTPHGYSFLMQNKDVSNIKKKFFYCLEKICSNIKGITIACSYGEYLEAKKLSKSVTYVSNGININEIDSILKNKKNKKNNSLTFSTLGRISDQKNPLLFNELARSFPNYSFKWIGNGEREEQLTSPNIEITGWLNRKDALYELETTDVFLLPSLWEGLPMSLLEAMYLKKICIVSNIKGNNNVIINKKNGFICDSYDNYVSVIKSIIKQEVDINNIKINAHNDILYNYNTEIMFNKYSNIYESGENAK
ncbi:glycosyltransferase [Limosilactobacillus reuteri]|uniref:Glycosyltransferase family 4 protein n=1 Tax=Limosilactobacillus reuteri TaxID=1598 RepID=A0AAW9ZJ93_LIMRT|nr:glycosyltransferase [Limosilactobacillus reuteri]MCC4344805.1 glycosyltransferase [Limosilactobacillus reuteri]MCC4357097.1 glycosyltransferase [Limosilactobacillus reuteri]NME23032.1 glycosyltransferase family 4 protein [Limosilactobacillus reuteri]